MNGIRHDERGYDGKGEARSMAGVSQRSGRGGFRNPHENPRVAGNGQRRMMSSTMAHPAGASAVHERSDEDLLAAHRQGDRASFSKIVARYQRELFHFLVRFLGDRAAAEDVFQEAFLQVHQSADQFDTARRFRPWLFTIAANKARDLIRSQARRPTNPLQASINPGDDDSGEFMDLMSSSDAFPDEAMQKAELQQQVKKTVLGMPQHLREILLLSYFHQFPYKQISDILAIPLGTVKSRLHAAVAHFADRWRAIEANKS